MWSLITGDEALVERPVRPVKPQTATLVVRNTRSTNKKAAAAASRADTPGDSVAGISLPLVTSDAYKETVEDYKLSIHEYKLDLDEFENPLHPPLILPTLQPM